MSDIRTLLFDNASTTQTRFVWRFITSAFAEGAREDVIVAAMKAQGVEQAEPWVRKIAKHRAKLLAGNRTPHGLRADEMRRIGRDQFRAVFGLPALTDEQRNPAAVEFPFTEAGDAEYFANRYRTELRYDHLHERWLQVDQPSGIWVPDDIAQIVNLAKDSIRARQADVLTLRHDGQRTLAQKWTTAGETRSRLTNTIALAESHPLVADNGTSWDQDPMILGCSNGVVDLRTSEFRRARPEERISKRVRVAYDPGAECPLWVDTLTSIFRNDEPGETQAMVDYFQRALGYSFTANCREECCFFTYGEGGNGKGTVMNTVGFLAQDYYDEMPYSTLEKNTRGSGIPNDVAKLNGKRFVTCSEVNEFTINEARLKALTGRDPMSARFLHKEWFTFIPVGHIWIATNNKPKIVGQDDGIWRRIQLIPFVNKFSTETGNINTSLKDDLRKELPGILAWIVRGARLWLEHGLNPPATVRKATQQYRTESDGLQPFIDSRLVETDGARTQASSLWDAYRSYCDQLHVESRLSQVPFLQRLRARYKVDDAAKRHTFYLGVGIRDQAPGRAY